MNSQGQSFDELYDQLLSVLQEFSSSALSGSVSTDTARRVIMAITSAYSEAYTDEVEYILKSLDIALDGTERNNINNKVNSSQFTRDNYERLAEILDRRADDIYSIKKEQSDKGYTDDEVKDKALNIILTITVSELQMAVERASVNSASAIEEVLDVKLTKTWNATLDDKTCEICASLHGTTIPVGASFSQTTAGKEYAEELSYGGNDTAYAHPRCRCWLTYDKA